MGERYLEMLVGGGGEMAEANPANQQAQFSQLSETPAVIKPEDREYRKGN